MRTCRGAYLNALVFLLCGLPAAAQVDIEKLRSEKRQDGLTGAVEFAVSVRSGNVDIQTVGLATHLDYRRQKKASLLVLNSDLGWQGGERFSDEGLGHFRQSYHLRDWLHPEGFVQAGFNKKRLLDFRGLIGGGLRLRLYYREHFFLWWGTNYMLEHEEVDVVAGDGHPAEVTVHRWSNSISAKAKLGQSAEATWTGYVQPRLARLEDIRILNETRMSAALTKSLALTLSFRLRYDSRPPQSIETVDYELKNVLQLKF